MWVLTPGAGLGRLSWEIAHLGFNSQGNEFSYFMLLASQFILNNDLGIKKLKIHPFILQNSNIIKIEDEVRSIAIPDISPFTIMSPGQNKPDFSMCAGEFVEVYKQQKGRWDCIVTCFFVDTAKNIIEYVETFWEILKPGGYWINLGPLLYHYADSDVEQSIELSYNEFKHVILSYGFIFLREETKSTTYTTNKLSMLQSIYNCVFFTCQKPIQ